MDGRRSLQQGLMVAALALILGLLPRVGSAADGWHAEYFANRHLSGAPALVRQDQAIEFDWGTGAPDAQIPANEFSARWTQTITLEGGHYEFSVSADDGVRLFVDGRAVVDDWRDSAYTTRRSTIYLGTGAHSVRLEYYEAADNAAVRLSWVRKEIPRPIGNIITYVDAGTWVKVYRRMPDNRWQLMNPGGTGRVDASGRIKIDGLPVEPIYGDKGQAYRVELWEQGRMVRSVGDTTAGQPEWILYPFRDNYTPWGPPATTPAPEPAPQPTPLPTPLPVPSTPDGGVQPVMGSVVNAEHLNVRKGPGPSNAVLTTLHRGQTVELTGYRNAKGSWIQIRANGVTGWVNGYYIRHHGIVTSFAVAG